MHGPMQTAGVLARACGAIPPPTLLQARWRGNAEREAALEEVRIGSPGYFRLLAHTARLGPHDPMQTADALARGFSVLGFPVLFDRSSRM
eukprot:SAG11_NODE_5911_length_1434_cov_4.065918_2_plen_90_part_00